MSTETNPPLGEDTVAFDEQEAAAPAPPTPDLVMGLRYSLPSMLAEIRLEKISGSYAMEKLDQKEIGKLFKPKKRARAKPTE
jgi:hypothetical protein